MGGPTFALFGRELTARIDRQLKSLQEGSACFGSRLPRIVGRVELVCAETSEDSSALRGQQKTRPFQRSIRCTRAAENAKSRASKTSGIR